MSDQRLERVEETAALLRERGLDALLVSAPANVRYLTGYTGSNGIALVFAEGERHTFYTDFRYATQAEEEVIDRFARDIAPVDLLGALGETLGAATAAAGVARQLGFDEHHLTVAQHTRLAELLGDRVALVPSGGLVEQLREVKDDEELARIAAAAELADEALREVLETGLGGRTEREVANELELAMRRLGAETSSFPTIVAAGPHGALPHAQPREVVIPSGVLVTIDWGAFHDGYCSDCTRTFAVGEIGEREREVYAVVLDAQEQGLAAVQAGRTGQEVDAIARAVIERAGYGEHFGHGLGHGVGIEVHEGPRLSRFRADAPLRAGNVVTIEPGVYLAGELGVRIEDLIVVTDERSRVLSTLPKELVAVT